MEREREGESWRERERERERQQRKQHKKDNTVNTKRDVCYSGTWYACLGLSPDVDRYGREPHP